MDKLQQRWPLPGNPKPIVFIGAGSIVRDAHIPAYKLAGFELAGVTDPDEARAKSLVTDYGVARSYKSIAEMVMENQTNAIYDIATPPHVIAGILEQLPDNAAVLIQKPMGGDINEAKLIRDICRRKNLKAAVNFQLRFSPMMLAAKQAIEQGKIGELLDLEVHVNIYTPWHIFPFLIPMERVEILVHSIHYLDSLRALAGNPLGVFARSLNDPRSKDFAQTRTSVILDYEAPLRGLMSINHNHQNGRKFQSAWIRVEGTDGCMMIKLGVNYDYPNGEKDELWISHKTMSGSINTTPSIAEQEWQQIPLEGSWFIESFMGPMSNLQRYDQGEDRTLYTGIEDAYQTMSLVESCFTSIKQSSVPLILD